jgi:glycerophosphoryl diester phosphodiesterase
MTRITGHRGARGLWPENSVAGFRNVVALGVDAVEFDVHLTGAGELVVIHDPMLERTTDGSGPVRDLTPDRRAGLRLTGGEETLPTFAEVLSVLAPARGLDLQVEIKSDPDGRPYPGIVERVVAEIDRHGLRPRCTLASFDVSVLAECRRVAPDVSRLVAVDATWADRQGGLERFVAGVGELAAILAVHHRLMAAHWDLVVSAIAAGRLCVWTVNDEAGMRAWFDRGVGHLTTDRPDLALAVRAGDAG